MGVAFGPPSGPSAPVFLGGTADSATALLPLTAAHVPATLAQPVTFTTGDKQRLPQLAPTLSEVFSLYSVHFKEFYFLSSWNQWILSDGQPFLCWKRRHSQPQVPTTLLEHGSGFQ